MLTNERSKFTLKNEHLWIFALTLFFAVNMNYDWREGYVAWYGTLAIVFCAYLLTFHGRFPLRRLTFSYWLLSFMALCLFSLIWSISTSESMTIIKSLIVCFAVLLLIQFSLNYGFSVDTMLKCYLVATAINTVYLIFAIDLSELGDTQLGTHLMDGWNGNGIGFMMTQGVLIGYYLFEKSKIQYEKIFCIVCICGFAALTIYTGSRTAFIMLIVEMVMYFWMRHPTKIVGNIVTIMIAIAIILYLVMNVKSFYNVLGHRLEGLFALFGGSGEIDSSANIRDTFIDNGKMWFAKKPFLGYGINTYKVLNKAATGRAVYAHNTFIELAVDLGIVGLILYYSVYIYLAYKLFKTIKGKPINVFLLSALIASLISQYGTVSYYDFYQNFLIMLCFFATNKDQTVDNDLNDLNESIEEKQ